MWVFTDTGFYSIVDKGPRGTLVVRSRAKADLQRLLRAMGSGAVVQHSTHTDYPFRVVVPRVAVQRWLASVAEQLQYPNFKDRAKRTLGPARERQLHRVWADMFDSVT